MSASRDDLGAEGNEARRRFWEMCASRQPQTLFNQEGDCLWSEEPADIAAWADKMLAEWDKRWIAEPVRWRCESCGHFIDDHDPANGDGHTIYAMSRDGQPELCGPVVRYEPEDEANRAARSEVQAFLCGEGGA